MEEWTLPLWPAGLHLLVTRLENVEMGRDENSELFLARIRPLEATMRAASIEKSGEDIIKIILRQLPDSHDVEKRSVLWPTLT